MHVWLPTYRFCNIAKLNILYFQRRELCHRAATVVIQKRAIFSKATLLNYMSWKESSRWSEILGGNYNDDAIPFSSVTLTKIERRRRRENRWYVSKQTVGARKKTYIQHKNAHTQWDDGKDRFSISKKNTYYTQAREDIVHNSILTSHKEIWDPRCINTRGVFWRGPHQTRLHNQNHTIGEHRQAWKERKQKGFFHLYDDDGKRL